MLKHLSITILFLVLHLHLSGQDTLIIRDADLQGSAFWQSDKVYVLDGEVTLESGGLLIEPGTRIIGKSTPTVAGDTFSGLTIGAEAQLIARGTAEDPIVFSSDKEGIVDPFVKRGSWRGLTIEGSPGEASSLSLLSYVSIQDAGASEDGISGAALFLKDLDDGPEFSFIEVLGSGGDGIRIHGGEVELAYTSVMFTKDDGYDWDYGWTGVGLYWLAYQIGRYQEDKFYDEESFAIEGKGNLGTNGRISTPRIYNATLIGNSCGWQWNGYNVISVGNVASVGFKDNSAGTLANSLIIDFPEKGVKVEDVVDGPDCRRQVETGNLQLLNNVWWSKQNPYDFYYGTVIREFNTGENGIILTDAFSEDPDATYLVDHLINKDNVIAGIGIWANRAANQCISLDPRPHPTSMYDEYPNSTYPNEDLFTTLVEHTSQKGAFAADALWLENWSGFAEHYYFGESAQTYFVYKDRINPSDTIKVYCEDLANFHNDIGYYYPCLPTIVLTTASSRKGNKRRPARERSGEGDFYAFVEDWAYTGLNHGCEGTNLTKFTLVVYDTLPPVIHPVPDENGGLGAIVEDCDDAWITNTVIDTITNSQGIPCVRYHFFAEDYSGNASDLVIEQKLEGAPITLYADMDGDGQGNPHVPILAYGPISGFVDNALDCNDNTPDDCPEDICEKAPVVAVGSPVGFLFNQADKTIYPFPDEDCGFYNTFSDVWCQFTGPSSGSYFLEIRHEGFSEGYGAVAELYMGSCEQLQFVDCFADGPSLFAHLDNLIAGANYYVRIYDPSNIRASEISVKLVETESVISNPNCGLAIPLETTLDNCSVSTFSTEKNAPSYYLETPCGILGGNEQWFSYVPISSDTASLTIEPPHEDVGNVNILIYRNNCGEKELIGCDIWTISGNEITLPPSMLVAGETLLIQVLTIGTATPYEMQICQSEAFSTAANSPHVSTPELSIFPNPTPSGSELTLEVQLPEACQLLRSQLLDTQGRVVGQIFNKAAAAGSFRHRTLLPDLPSGIYFLQLQSEHFSVTKKIVIL